MDDIKTLLTKFKISPKDKELYSKAFTHRSALNEDRDLKESNERLEFLGDSVLSIIISTFLFQQRPSDNEGDLTNLRAFIVKTDSLAKAAEQLKLGEYLRLSKGEEVTGGRNNNQLLANTYEAFLGAIYLDQGLPTTQRFVTETLLPLFEKEIIEGAPKDIKSTLQEVAQAKFQISPKYKVLETTGPDHAKKFRVGVYIGETLWGEGEGNSKQLAEEQAATEATSGLTKTL